jgi:hypothetical protein
LLNFRISLCVASRGPADSSHALRDQCGGIETTPCE